MAIAMQAQGSDVAGAVEAVANARERHLRHCPIGLEQIWGDEVVRKQVGARFVAKSRDVECRARREGRDGPNRMQAPDEPAHPFERGRIIQLGRAPAALGIHGEAETFEPMQCPTVA
jgi:hypothetical protein